MRQLKTLPLILVGLVIIGIYLTAFIVTEREKAVLFRLGEVIRTDFEPGLHFKMPFVNNVRKFDARVLNLDSPPELFLTSEKKNVVVDTFIKWRIGDVKRFYTAVQGDEERARLRLEQIIKDGLRSEFGKRTIQEVVSGERLTIMRILSENASRIAKEIGIDVVDVRIKRIDLPPEVSNSVYRRMEAERARVSREFRSRGAEAAERIRANADRERTVILAEATEDSEKTRGEGDAVAADIYAQAYNKNPDFYSLYRSLNSYRTIFAGNQDILLLEPDNEFFKYFNNKGK